MQLVRLVFQLPSNGAHLFVLCWLGASIAPKVAMYHGCNVRRVKLVRIGEGTSIGDQATRDPPGDLSIGRNVNVSTDVQIWTAQHKWASADFGYSQERVVVGDRVRTGPRVIILPGTMVGDGVVIAAGAVAHGEPLAHTFYAGVPAKPIA